MCGAANRRLADRSTLWVGRLAVAAMLYGSLVSAAMAAAASEADAPKGPQPGLGEATFQRICAACHTSLVARASPTEHPPDEATLRALPREMLRQLSPETVLTALTSGKMQAQGSLLSDAERHAVAEYATGSHFGAAKYGAPSTERPSSCSAHPSVAQFKDAPSWNGWGDGPANTRLQPRASGGVTAADLPKLKLEWAFGYINTAVLRAQPAVFGHRVFVSSEPGDIYALDAKTGCTYWTYKAQDAVSTAPSIGPYKTSSGAKGYAVYVGDRNANVYALDAQTGTLLWKRRVDEHRVAGITGAPALYEGRLFVPTQGVGEESIGGTNNYPCCTFRG